jgi:3-hydroxyisobutyrate dehydrogenase
MENLGKRIAQGDFQPGFMVKLLQKDLAILMDEAQRTGAPLLGTALVQQLYSGFERTGEETARHAGAHPRAASAAWGVDTCRRGG